MCVGEASAINWHKCVHTLSWHSQNQTNTKHETNPKSSPLLFQKAKLLHIF
ncbi:hypothetical protein KsCSTR_03500 [Candidatus Kuenenia stuttgartiensis]|uniref:Uncharacterized protein n=1 Tax=Kuenenia stuttgartiensis TaxID=174633 RepID=Q1PXW9_KUEST|nr:hypothetical protein KsCSTR_03500 [Candidatus Kuenenia stuttgartiensis]CAJ72884.1 unknown protein [Candidatus Kuenenia stuttgartiensis]